jgi:polysaccharide export outer membrane protein
LRQCPFQSRSRAIRWLARAGALSVASLLLLSFPAAQSQPVLTGIDVELQGRLVRVTLEATGPLDRFALSRQGPPNDRDLVLTLHGVERAGGFERAGAEAVELGVPYEITAVEEEGRPGLRVVMARAGDSLVRLDQEAGRLSLVVIPLEKSRPQSGDAYFIGADDVLSVSVFGHEDLTRTVKVSPDGVINYPLIGNVRAARRTVDEIAAEIRERLAVNFLVDPHVTVSVWEYLSQWVNVMGEVIKPGRYYMTGPTTLIDAISQAGGLKPTAGDAILVTRRPEESDPAAAWEPFHFSTPSLLSDKEGAADFRMRPGDVVNVLASEVIYVSGAVRSPGSYPLARGTTLMRAITLAGGFSREADQSVLVLIREEGGRRERLSFAVEEIEEQKIADPLLQPGDEVVVRSRS